MRPEEEAVVCANASAAMYGTATDSDGRAACEAALGMLGFNRPIWYDLPTSFQDFCAVVASSDKCHLLAFRGTKTPKDWMTDLASTPARFEWVFSGGPALGEIHSGFGHCLSDAFQRLTLPLAKADQSKPLLITGHSLGGALAALAGVCFTALHSPVPPIAAIYTFGQPRIGLRDFCESYSKLLPRKLVRFVNKCDIVPRVPFRTWDYGDYGKMIHFDSNEKPLINSAEWQSFLTQTYGGFAELVEFTLNLRTDVGDHSMTEYRRLVEQNQTALSALLR